MNLPTYEQYLRGCTVREDELDRFLSPDVPTWARFDHELGYVLSDSMQHDGIDGCLTFSTTWPNGARRGVVYADRPVRINTYGNSYTQCHQVSDQETWQEYLAGHLGEPIRNLGVGGFGLYQAYLRMCRFEATAPAEYVVLYLWGDDHTRSLFRCRLVQIMDWHRSQRDRPNPLFHGNFWAHLEMDLETGQLVDKPNRLPTPESLYQMTDEEFMVEAMRGDLMMQMCLFRDGRVGDLDRGGARRLADILEIPQAHIPWDGSADELRPAVSDLCQAYAFAASRSILDRAAEFARSQGKQLMVVLQCPMVLRQLVETGRRYDQPIADHLQASGLRTFDMNLVHVEDFKQFNLDFDAYMGRYFAGHYTPAGNHFFAYAIKDTIVDWLEPKPIPYRTDHQPGLDFREGYLPES